MGDLMPKEAWPVKLLLGVVGFVIAGAELTFGGRTSQSILLMISLMLIIWGWAGLKGWDREE